MSENNTKVAVEMANSGESLPRIAKALGLSIGLVKGILRRAGVRTKPRLGLRIKDISGQRFGYLVAEQVVGKADRSNSALWRCRCDCGGTTVVVGSQLRSGKRVACGCSFSYLAARANPHTTHGHTRRNGTGRPVSKTYAIWGAMVQRCTNPKNARWAGYGGRGITVCDRWLEFENFLADMGEKPEGRSIDRIDNDRGYEPSNCRWATNSEQYKNKRGLKFEPHEPDQVRWLRAQGHSLKEIARFFGASETTVRAIVRNKAWVT